MGMEYIPAFFGYRQSLASLTDEQFGKVVRAALEYAEEGTVPDFAGVEALAFAVMRGDIDRAKVKYEAIAERNRVNGMKGGRPKNPENPVGYLGTQNNPENPEEPRKPIQNNTKQDNTKQHKGVDVASGDAAPVQKKAEKKQFVPPTVEEVFAYIAEAGLSVDAERFVDYYAGNGWKVGSQGMKDWKATVRNWARRDKERGFSGPAKPAPNKPAESSFDTEDFFDAALQRTYGENWRFFKEGGEQG